MASNELNSTSNIVDILLPTDNKIHRSYIYTIGLVLIFTIITILTALGNILVITAVAIVHKLRHPSNLLIVSLAFSDLLVSIMVMPFGSYFECNQSWDLGSIACDIYIVFDVLLCTASILNLCAISIDRYLAVTKPLEYVTKRTSKRMILMITISWIISALISIPPTFGFKEKFTTGVCLVSQNFLYQIFATSGAFYLPLIVMLILYGRIVILARKIVHSEKSNKFIKSSSANVLTNMCRDKCFKCSSIKFCLFCKQNSKEINTKKNSEEFVLPEICIQTSVCKSSKLEALSDNKDSYIDQYHRASTDKNGKIYNFTSKPIFFHDHEAVQKDLKNESMDENSKDLNLLNLQYTLNKRIPNVHHYSKLSLSNASIGRPVQTVPAITINENSNKNDLINSNLNAKQLARKRAASDHISDFQPSKRRNTFFGKIAESSLSINLRKQINKRSNETKAIRTLGVIMGVFCLCWLPFFIVALGLPLYNYIRKTNVDINVHIKSFVLWLGYINSTLNPMIYAIFNRDFRQPFWEILQCHWCDINARLRSKRYHNEFGVNTTFISGIDNPNQTTIRSVAQVRHSLLVERGKPRKASLFDEKMGASNSSIRKQS